MDRRWVRKGRRSAIHVRRWEGIGSVRKVVGWWELTRSSTSWRGEYTVCQPDDSCFFSEPVRLRGGSSHCTGTLEVKQANWRPVFVSDWTLKEAAVVCGDLDCGSALSIERRTWSSERAVWTTTSKCVHSGSAMRDCVKQDSSSKILEITCSGMSIIDLISNSHVCSVVLPLSQWQPMVSIWQTCEVIQENHIVRDKDSALMNTQNLQLVWLLPTGQDPRFLDIPL